MNQVLKIVGTDAPIESNQLNEIKEEQDKAIVKMPAVQKESTSLVAQAKNLEIKTVKDYEIGFEYISAAKRGIKAVEAIYKPVKQSIDKHKGSILDLEKSLKAPFKEVENVLTPKLREFKNAQEAIRQKEIAEERARQRKAEEDARIERAVEAEKAGHHQAAQAALETPIVQPVMVRPAALSKIQGAGFTGRWSAEVVDLKLLCKSILEGKVPITAIQPNMTLLNAQARALKEHFDWPGVKAVLTETTFSRR